NADRVLDFFYRKTVGQREQLFHLLDIMYVESDRKKISISLWLASFGLGFVVFLALRPNVFPGLILGTAMTLAGWSIPKTILKNMWEKRCSRLVDQMVDGMTIMANGIKSGLSIT